LSCFFSRFDNFLLKLEPPSWNPTAGTWKTWTNYILIKNSNSETHLRMQSQVSTHSLQNIYRCAPVSTGNTFQDLLQLLEPADNNKFCILCDICVININMVNFNL
jgi:hypothetical protein